MFNAALVTPTYYVFFTSATIVTSAILFQGFKGTPIEIATVIMGFLQICSGVVLLQLSKSAKDVPDAAVFKGDLDQVREVAEQEQPEYEPKADAIRGGASIVRRFSQARQKMEQEEAKRLRHDTLKDRLEPLAENEVVEWDGLRRRKTVIGSPSSPSVARRKTQHPPLGMSRFPDANEVEEQPNSHFFENLKTRAQTMLHLPQPDKQAASDHSDGRSGPINPVALTEINVHPANPPETPVIPYGPGSFEEAQEHIYGYQPNPHGKDLSGMISPRSKPLPSSPKSQHSLQPPHSTRRQFSFTNIFHRDSHSTPESSDLRPPTSRHGLGSRQSSYNFEKRVLKNATEEERLGLVKGDSHSALLSHESSRSPPRYDSKVSHTRSSSRSTESESFTYDEDDYDDVDKIISSHHHRHGNPALSDSDKDDEWQMTSPPARPSPPPIPTTVASITTKVGLPGNPKPNAKSPLQNPPPNVPPISTVRQLSPPTNSLPQAPRVLTSSAAPPPPVTAYPSDPEQHPNRPVHPG